MPVNKMVNLKFERKTVKEQLCWCLVKPEAGCGERDVTGREKMSEAHKY